MVIAVTRIIAIHDVRRRRELRNGLSERLADVALYGIVTQRDRARCGAVRNERRGAPLRPEEDARREEKYTTGAKDTRDRGDRGNCSRAYTRVRVVFCTRVSLKKNTRAAAWT